MIITICGKWQHSTSVHCIPPFASPALCVNYLEMGNMLRESVWKRQENWKRSHKILHHPVLTGWQFYPCNNHQLWSLENHELASNCCYQTDTNGLALVGSPLNNWPAQPGLITGITITSDIVYLEVSLSDGSPRYFDHLRVRLPPVSVSNY